MMEFRYQTYECCDVRQFIERVNKDIYYGLRLGDYVGYTARIQLDPRDHSEHHPDPWLVGKVTAITLPECSPLYGFVPFVKPERGNITLQLPGGRSFELFEDISINHPDNTHPNYTTLYLSEAARSAYYAAMPQGDGPDHCIEKANFFYFQRYLDATYAKQDLERFQKIQKERRDSIARQKELARIYAQIQQEAEAQHQLEAQQAAAELDKLFL